MRTSRTAFAWLAAILLALSALPAMASDKPSNKWRMSFSGGASSDGHIELRLTPEGAEAQYHVERDDGEDVLVKKRGGAPDFLLEVVANTVEGVRINNKRK